MLNLKEQTIKELDELKPQALAKVYDLITELKRINQAKKSKPIAADYIKVREALKQCKGSLSEDIILEREDRILIYSFSSPYRFENDRTSRDQVRIKSGSSYRASPQKLWN